MLVGNLLLVSKLVLVGVSVSEDSPFRLKVQLKTGATSTTNTAGSTGSAVVSIASLLSAKEALTSCLLICCQNRGLAIVVAY